MPLKKSNKSNRERVSCVLCCSAETKKMILEECYTELIENNPQLKGVDITQDFLLKRIAQYYLKR